MARHASLGDNVYLTLRREILSLVIAPRAQLDEAALVRRFAVSRTPVGEATRRLVADKLVELIPHLLSMIPYKDLTPKPIRLPPRQKKSGYVRPPITDQTFVPEKEY